MKKNKTALVLEGGGMRGAYTAGALTWLIDNDIEFDNAYGISTGAVHLCNYLMKDKVNLKNFSVEYIMDKRLIGLRPFMRCGRIVDYDYMFNEILCNKAGYTLEPLKDCKVKAGIGLYELDKGMTEYAPVQELTINELKAACTLPIIGKTVHEKNRDIFDGGITEMIPIKEAMKDGCTRNLVITTKPLDYVRKPAKQIVVDIMKLAYRKHPKIAEQYKIRHLNYVDQIGIINELVEKKEALYCYPSEKSNVTRLGGSYEELVSLFELGYSDMEKRKESILALLND